MTPEELGARCARFVDEIHQRLGPERGDGPDDIHFALVFTDGKNTAIGGERGLANLVEQGIVGVMTHDFGPKEAIAARWRTEEGVYDRRRTHT
jgi:hypothetical protein